MTDSETNEKIEDELEQRALRRARAVNALRRLGEANLSVVPQSPSQYMCAVGAQVGGVDLFTARRVYRAMVAAAYERPTIN
jgi:hypothetical protein